MHRICSFQGLGFRGLGFHACGRTASDLEFKMVGGVGFYGLGSIGPLHQGTLRNFRVLGSGFTV